MTERKSYWNGNRNNPAADFIQAQIPTEGECPKEFPALENWRRFTNGYYDIFNNGACNWGSRGPGFRAAIKSIGHETIAKSDLFPPYEERHHKFDFSRPIWERLELVGDAILRAALLEQANETQAKEWKI